jgi:uncharacterized protein YndB with AHSA1/START domain
VNELDTLHVSVRIAAPPAEVFPYFVDPALLVQWIGDRADLRPESGGIFAVDMGNTPVRGQFVVVDPPNRVVFTWGVAGSEVLPVGSTTVEIVLTADGPDTIVELTHRDLPPDERPKHGAGWTARLSHLGVRAARH